MYNLINLFLIFNIIFVNSIDLNIASNVKKNNAVPGFIKSIDYIDYNDQFSKNNNNKVDLSDEDKNAVGYIVDGEWLKYNVNILTDSTYKFSYFVSGNTNNPVNLELFLLLDTVDCTNTSIDQRLGTYTKNFKSNNWNNYKELTNDQLYKLPKGQHTLTMCFKQAEWISFNGFSVTEVKQVRVTNTPVVDVPDVNFHPGVNTFDYINWSTRNQQLMLNNNPFHLKGLNWYGFNNDRHNLIGIENRSMESYLDFIKARGFNSLRIPITVQFVNEINNPVKSCNPEFGDCSLNAKDTLLKLFRESAKRGILILVDMHSRSDNNYLDALWYGNDYSEDQFIDAWKKILNIVVDEPNLLGIDLFNEPNGEAVWGGGGKNDWFRMINRLVEEIYYGVPNFDKTIFVEGINFSTDFHDYEKYPINFSHLSDDLDNRVILSPHFYGPSVVPQSDSWNANNYPDNLPPKWDANLGIVEKKYHRTSIITEWGGLYNGKDKQWQDKFGQYLVDNCLEDNFVWNLSATSGDTGGILKADNYTPEDEKLALYNSVQPYPSFFVGEIKKNAIAVDFGQYANPSCNY